MTDRLQGKVAIITGGTSGIGRATVDRFVAEGASVIFSGRRKQLGDEIAEGLGENATFIQADVEQESEVAALVEHAVDRFGRLDVLFNNAGGPAPSGSIIDVPTEDFDASVRLLLRSVFFGMKHAAPVMKEAGRGSIISNASVAAHLGGYSTSHVYAALKAGIVQLSKSVALELSEFGVRVNTVSPGAIATGIFGRGAGLSSDEADAAAAKMEKLLKKSQPIPRAGRPEDVAAAVLYLASDDAEFVSGRDIVVDGAMIAGRRWSEVEQGRHAMKGYLSRDDAP